ncbi:MAG: methyltransferase domain-containing protein [Paludibacter sp.]|nr:methyltransferase domain-containing protein [Paludibacter sp.]
MDEINKKEISFRFGENWKSFVEKIGEEDLASARKNIEEWLGANNIRGKTVIDIGCGSGIHSLAFWTLGAKEVLSFDLDSQSVEASKMVWENAGKPDNWKILTGSILDEVFLSGLGEHSFDIVYSWGVLHHTGKMWEAVDNALSCVKMGGYFWIALYVKGPSYQQDFALKIMYNKASAFRKKVMRGRAIADIMKKRLKNGHNPLEWNQKKSRGMNTYHDIVDWLGGLPYEVASVDEVVDFTRKKGLILEKIQTGEANNIYLFSSPLA